MGLDAVEILMDVEDHFGITICNTESEGVRTVGDLVSVIQKRIDATRTAVCPSLASFLNLRRRVREIVADDCLRIRTRTRVVDVLNPSQRRQLWSWLGDRQDATPRGLRRPPWLRKLLVVAVLLVFLFAVWSASIVNAEILPLTLLLAIMGTWFLHSATVWFRQVPPAELSTFGALARYATQTEFATKHLNLKTAEEVLAELRPVLVDALGVDASEIVPSARFIEDLGMD
ncbi:acyl carrier protein [Aporhodopirellula aestuarii]|uniref:Acyl carrier protein n=1 Tax=Aporhodopirellula aestuarii TaxID=2950107 RepID=A0ABT0U0T8_9BACT|nr:acyl carrier protein [Aporhodopirellula aestuarii]MCM2370489.1 acyl carrier protein [Aporhodopirellula aestuarii]